MRRKLGMLILLVFSICTVISVPNIHASFSANLTYYITVKENANATVRILFEAEGSGIGFIGLPLFENYSVSVTKGNIEWLKYKDISVFYTNATFRFSGKHVKMIIDYEFPYASLIAGNTAWFMSPLILTSTKFNVFVEVKLYNLDSKEPVKFWPYDPIEREEDVFVFHIRNPSMDSRVIIEYKILEEAPTITYEKNIGETRVTVQVAKYYKDIADKVFSTFDKTYEKLKYVFDEMPNKLNFEFYLPELNDLSALGYVKEKTIDIGAEGPIYLNLALIRFKEGFLEETIIHELVHLELGRLGVASSREIRWFHEGMAEYLAIKICNISEINVTDFEEAHREAIKILLEKYGENFSFIVNWDYDTPLVRLYYSASYYIINKTAEEHGGLIYTQKLVNEIKEMGGLKNNNDVIEAMSNAANEDLKPQFREWGFPIEGDENNTISSDKNNKLLQILQNILGTLLIILLVIIIVIVVIIALIFRWLTRKLRGSTSYTFDIE